MILLRFYSVFFHDDIVYDMIYKMNKKWTFDKWNKEYKLLQ